MRRKHFRIEVPMNYFHFDEVTLPAVEGMDVKVRDQLQITRNAAAKSSADASQKKSGMVTHPERTHLEHKFVNETDDDQTYEFRFEKTRTASVSVSYQKGFSIGGKANFSLDLAHVPGLEIEARYEVRKETGQTFDETMTTSVKSDVTVKAHRARKAIVVMEERRIHAKFEVTVKMTMPVGKAVVYIYNKHGDRISTRQIQNLIPVFNGKYNTKQNAGQAAEFLVKGIVEGSMLSNHKICLQDIDEPKTGKNVGQESLDATADSETKFDGFPQNDVIREI
nr:hypothetical protein BaRGS_016916 [Batillaria attramentaria]